MAKNVTIVLPSVAMVTEAELPLYNAATTLCTRKRELDFFDSAAARVVRRGERNRHVRAIPTDRIGHRGEQRSGYRRRRVRHAGIAPLDQ